MWVSGKHAAPIEKPVVGADELDQLARVLEAALGLRPLLLALRRVAAQGEHVVEAEAAHLVERGAQLVDRRADAGEVRHRLEADLVADARDDLERLAAGRAAGAVGDADEVRAPAGAGPRAPGRGSPRPRASWAGRTRRRTPGGRPTRRSRRCASRPW